MGDKTIKPKRSRLIVDDINYDDLPIEPSAQIYKSKIEEYRKFKSESKCNIALEELKKVDDVMIIESPEVKPKKKRPVRKKKIEVEEPLPIANSSDSDDAYTERDCVPESIRRLRKKGLTLSQATVRRLDRLKRASEIEIKRLTEEKARILTCATFNSPINDDIEYLEEDNREILLRIQYIMDVHRIPCKENQKFSSIIPEIAKTCNINAHEILLCFKDKTITLEDTPSTLGISLADVIECCIYKPDIDDAETEVMDKNHLEIKIQSNDSKKKTVMFMHKLEKMQGIMQKYADQRDIPLKDFIFEFDGEKLTGSETPEQLDMESGSCIDARLVKPLVCVEID